MAEYTKKQLAEHFGCNKQTVANVIAELGIEEHVTRHGNTDYLDEFAQSAIANRLSKRFKPAQKEPEKDPYKLLYKQEKDLRIADSERYQKQIDQQQEFIEHLKQQIKKEADRADKLIQEREQAKSDLMTARETLARISAAGFFTNKKAMAKSFLALPSPK